MNFFVSGTQSWYSAVRLSTFAGGRRRSGGCALPVPHLKGYGGNFEWEEKSGNYKMTPGMGCCRKVSQILLQTATQMSHPVAHFASNRDTFVAHFASNCDTPATIPALGALTCSRVSQILLQTATLLSQSVANFASNRDTFVAVLSQILRHNQARDCVAECVKFRNFRTLCDTVT